VKLFFIGDAFVRSAPLTRSPIYKARSGFSAATAFAIGLRLGLTPVAVFAAGSGESPKTTNVQLPDPADVVGPVAAGTVGTGAGAGVVHPETLIASITIRKSVSLNNRIVMYFNPGMNKAVIFRVVFF
jgi:hypothetical protein